MITLQNADSILKSFYLDAISESLNYKTNPFFAKIERTANDVVGKDVRKVVRFGINSGVRAGTETGDLPDASTSNYATFVAPLKNIYGTIEISDKALRATATNEGAFINILNEEMKALEKSASVHFSRMLFGDGTGYLGTVTAANSQGPIVTCIENFVEGMCVEFRGQGEAFSRCIIKSVDRSLGKINFDSSEDPGTIAVGAKIYVSGTDNAGELTGLKALFDKDELYGLSKYRVEMSPQSITSATLTETIIQKQIDAVEEKTGQKIDFIICSWGVKRALVEYFNGIGKALPTMELEGGHKALSFNGIPVVADRFCPKGTMYLLTSECFKLCQLCDWEWLEAEDGKILKQVSGKPVYQATLVKYAELLCENPAAQARISGITEK